MLEKTKNVLIIVTGGTLTMGSVSGQGLIPQRNSLGSKLEHYPKFHDKECPLYTTPPFRNGNRVHYDIYEWDQLLDSSNMNMEHWVKMCSDIEDNYDKYDGFIIVHGTDTMAYSASALSFMLDHLSKPVVLTGSQTPLGFVPSDAEGNLIGAIMIAGTYTIPEVCIFFDNKLMRGNRSTKQDATAYNAFSTPNYGILVNIGTDIIVNWKLVRSPPLKSSKLKTHKKFCGDVGVLKLFPGITSDIIRNFLQPPLKGCVLETYGSGNAPNNRPDFLEALKEAIDRGVVILNVTQCSVGIVEDGVYQTNTSIKSIGVVGGGDMTTEAALAKLSYLLSLDLSPTQIRNYLKEDIRGERTRVTKRTFSLTDESFIRHVAEALISFEHIQESEPNPFNEDYIIKDVKKALFPVLLCYAASVGNIDNLKSLLSVGANINIGDYDQRTALHVACGQDNLDVVLFLLSEGANINAQDKWGNTPLDEAIMYCKTHIVDHLKLMGALPNTTLIENNNDECLSY